MLTSNDPTAHAEIIAIRAAAAKRQDFALAGCSLFTSCEPCPMCFAAAYWARVDAVYFANTRDQAASIGFDDAAIYAEVNRQPGLRKEMPTIHIDLPEAKQAFDAWLAKADRVNY